jgi:hypothetical protein
VGVTPAPFDADAVLASIDAWRRGGSQLADLFRAAGVESVDDDELREAVHERLAAEPRLVEAWQAYSYDKRWTPSPYLDGLEVGHHDGGHHHVRAHPTTTDACADFVLAEVRWVVERRIIEPA